MQPSRYSCELLYVPIRSVYVPIRFLIQKTRLLSKVIRSYTFRATLSQFLRIVLYVQLATSRTLFANWPLRPSKGICYAVPIRSLYVPIRSVGQLGAPISVIHYFAHLAHFPQMAIAFTFLYVPVYVPIRSRRPLHFPASGGATNK